MKSILNKEFRYVRSVETDIRKTFARVRREQEKAKEKPQNVTVIRKAK